MVNNLIQNIISSLVGLIIVNIFQHLFDYRGNYEDIFRVEEKKLRDNKEYKVNSVKKLEIFEEIRKISSTLKIKIILFLILEFSIMLFFYYFVTAFCEVYKKTQISWLYDFFTGFIISFCVEILFAFLLTLIYKISIKYKMKFIYNLTIFCYNI